MTARAPTPLDLPDEFRRLLRQHHDASYAEAALIDSARRTPPRLMRGLERALAREQGRVAGLAFRIAELYHEAQYERIAR